MDADSNYGRIITAAHRGSHLAQEALAVIEDTRFMLLHSCSEHHILPPTDYDKTQISEAISKTLISRSPWLQGMLDKYAKVEKPAGAKVH